MGFWKKFGKIASIAAPIVAAPFTGGLSLALIGAGAGAAGGLLGGGGWKGALMGAGMGAIPGVGAGGGLAKGAVAPALSVGLKQAAKAAITPAALAGAGAIAKKVAGGGGDASAAQLAGMTGGTGGTGGTGTDGGDNMAGWGSVLKDYGPLIAQGAGMVAGGFAGKKATSMAMERSPEEVAAIRGATDVAGQSLGAGKELLGQGKELTQSGRGMIQGPANYYQTLLSGNRAAMSNAVSPAVAQITGNYRGATRALQHSGVRGAARDFQAGELNRQRVGAVAGQTTGVQGGAATALAGLGGQVMGAGASSYGAGANLHSNAGNVYSDLLRSGTVNRQYGRQEGEKTATAIGGLARDLGEIQGKKKAAGATPPRPAGPGSQAGIPTGALPGSPTQMPTMPQLAGMPSGGQFPGNINWGAPRSPYDNVTFGGGSF